MGALAYDADGRLLLIRRGNEPGRGLWSVPGGRVEPGESDAEAVVREMAEETGLVVEPGALVGRCAAGRTRSPTTGARSSAARCARATTPPTPAGATPPRWRACRWSPLLYDTLREWDALPR